MTFVAKIVLSVPYTYTPLSRMARFPESRPGQLGIRSNRGGVRFIMMFFPPGIVLAHKLEIAMDKVTHDWFSFFFSSFAFPTIFPSRIIDGGNFIH